MTIRDFSIDEHRKMNMPPETFIRVPHGAMETFVAGVASSAGLDDEKAGLLARLLTENDLRGTFSHGTQSIARYARAMRDGAVNASPVVRVVRETPVSLLIDGDGGLGYFPAYEGTLRAIEKAKSQGMAVMVTRNHGHIGAAGIYTRMTLEHDLLTMITGGSQMDLQPGQPVYAPAVGSPSSFSAPAGEEAPFVLDFGALYDLRTSAHYAEVAEWLPGTVFRSIGLGVVSKVWGGLLAGTACGQSSVFAGGLWVGIGPDHIPDRPFHRSGTVQARDGRVREEGGYARAVGGLRTVSARGRA